MGDGMGSSRMNSKANPEPRARRKRLPALTPWTRRMLYVVALGGALLGANSVYLAGISFLGWVRGQTYENQFYLWMFLLHLVVGIVLIPPFVIFAGLHLRNTWSRKNRRIKRSGHFLLWSCVVVIVTGLVMTVRVLPLDSFGGRASYWLHVLVPVLCILFYIMHRAYGRPIKWRWGAVYGTSVVLVAGGMIALHTQDPRKWSVRGGGEDYFKPAEVRTANWKWIPSDVLMRDQYCEECHPDAVKDHYQSVHHFSSFNNPIYLFSIRETRSVLQERDGDVRGARFCAACHDPVPLLSGAFDDPNYDDLNDPTAKEGVNCTVCHAITDVAGTIGNGNYTIEEPIHYPFATSENPVLHWVNQQLVKAKPAFHKKTFLKPLHKEAAFCTACHKVNIPYALNHYKEWLRGQNHYDNFLLSGISGHSARSFYYPGKAQPNCNECHMPRKPSDDFAAVDGEIHDHRMPGANTAIPHLMDNAEQRDFQAAFLKKDVLDVDIFGLKSGGHIDGELTAPIGPEAPRLEAGKDYLLEVVLRTLKNQGHVFTQGTSDSNEVWVELEARVGDRVVGRSGAIDEKGFVDPWAHFLNSLILDRSGHRIDRRNVQDIFVPLYSHMMPPGTGQVVHYLLRVPKDLEGVMDITVKVNYRKFDQGVMTHTYEYLASEGLHEGGIPEIPIVTLTEDHVRLPVGASGKVPRVRDDQPSKPLWQRWRDYGIGLLLKGNKGAQKGELRQAEEAFRQVVALGKPVSWIDLARVYEKEGRLDDAQEALEKAVAAGVEATWTVNWLSGRIDAQNGLHERAVEAFDKVLGTRIPQRGFDFSLDYQVILEKALSELQLARSMSEEGERTDWLDRAEATFLRVLDLDAENLAAHFNLMLVYRMKGDKARADEHRRLHAKYKPDDNARDSAVSLYRKENPAADKAAEAIVIYDLARNL